MKNGLRLLSTTQELRQVYNATDQGVKVRKKRTKNLLPNSWWDFWARSQRSWKKHRKTQYKI